MARSVYQYEQPRCPDNWNESERRFYNRLVQVLDDIYAKYGNIDEKMLSAKVTDKINSAPDAALDKLAGKYSEATVGSLYADLIVAETARITNLVVEKMVADTIQAGTIAADTVQATFAYMTSLTAKYGEFDFASVQNLLSNALVVEKGQGDYVHVTNLAATYAQMVNATIANLCIKSTEGGYYELDVDAQGNVKAKQVAVSDAEIMAGSTQGGKPIVGTNISAVNMDAETVAATLGLYNKVVANMIDVDSLVARTAFIQSLTSADAFISQLTAKLIQSDLGSRLTIKSDTGVDTTVVDALNKLESNIKQNAGSSEFVVGKTDEISRIYRQEEFPDGTVEVKPGDMLVIPSTGQQYQAVQSGAIRFAMDADGSLYYEYDGDGSLSVDGFDLYADGFVVSISEDGRLGTPYNWELVQDSELAGMANAAQSAADAAQGTADAASNYANEALDIANAALSRADFQRVVRIDDAGLHVGDNLTDYEVLLDSASVNVVAAGVRVSTFSDKFIRLDNMQIRKVRGGLAISVYNG